MTRHPRFVAVLAVALVLALAVGAGVWWFAVAPGQRARELAGQVAAGFAAGTMPEGLFDAAGVQGELARVYAGMGELRPEVAVTGVGRDAEGTMRAGLSWTWVVHAGKPSWQYLTSVPLTPSGNGWVAVWSPDAVAPGLVAGDSLRATRLAPVRGAVLGQGGVPLAWNQPAYRVGIDRTLTDAATAEASAAQVAALLGVDVDRFVERVKASAPKAFVEARVLRADDPAEAALAKQATRWIGVRSIATTRPLAISSSFARPLLGVVGEATAEQVEASGGTVRGGDLVGRGGLQEVRNHVLMGTTGFVVSVVPAEGSAREAFRVAALDGSDVVTTLDVGLQKAAEAALAGVGPASALVAIRPSDGAVVAAASGPGSAGLSTATLGQYPPGSTFKTVTSLALLRAGLTPDTRVSCTDGITVDGFRFDNWAGYPASALGDVPLRTAFAHSCNSAFVSQAQRVTQPDLAAAAASLGLTAEPRLVVGAFSGSVPAVAGTVEHAASLIGQGKVLASPLGMATVAASIASGRTVTPMLVREPGTATPGPAKPLTDAEASALRDLMRAVVTDGGGRALADVPGQPVLAKTGTATQGSGGFHGWMLAIRGDLAVAVFVEDASSGAIDAGPIVEAFLRATG